MNIYFSEVFGVPPRTLERYGAFDISLVADLPLFVDPFLVFNSRRPAYRKLHKGIVRYLTFLHRKARNQALTPGLVSAWYRFPEIRENWLGFSKTGNDGRGLGQKFAGALHENLGVLIVSQKAKRITKDIHLEKLCLVSDRVGRDNISDFTSNLIHRYLLEYTQKFSSMHIDASLRRRVAVRRVKFNYQTQTWESGTFDLPYHNGQHVILTPRDLLTRDDTWINKTDLVDDFDRLPQAIPNEQLREQVSNFFRQCLPPRRKGRRRKIKKSERQNAVVQTLRRFPELIDYYILDKEKRGSEARKLSTGRVERSERLYIEQIRSLRESLEAHTDFYRAEGTSYEAARQRALFLKDVIENKGGHRFFYVNGQPLEREEDLQIVYRFTWFGTSFDVGREANDGRGPADFKISKGAKDKSLVEMKLASNTSLERNLKHQASIYEKASDASRTVKVIICFSASDQRRVQRILTRLNMVGDTSLVVIDARKDNKPSGSKA